VKVGSLVRILNTFRKGYIGIVVGTERKERFVEVAFNNGYRQWYYPHSLEVVCEGR